MFAKNTFSNELYARIISINGFKTIIYYIYRYTLIIAHHPTCLEFFINALCIWLHLNIRGGGGSKSGFAKAEISIASSVKGS